MRKKSNVKQRAMKKENVVPKTSRLDVPIPPGMKLDHFRIDGTACPVVYPTTLDPKCPSKTNPARAKKKKGWELTVTISKSRKGEVIRKRMTRYQRH